MLFYHFIGQIRASESFELVSGHSYFWLHNKWNCASNDCIEQNDIQVKLRLKIKIKGKIWQPSLDP